MEDLNNKIIALKKTGLSSSEVARKLNSENNLKLTRNVVIGRYVRNVRHSPIVGRKYRPRFGMDMSITGVANG